MNLNFHEYSKQSNQDIFCIEYDGDITCFELGNLPLPPKDPRELGITLPCCMNKKNNEKLNKNQHDNEDSKKPKAYCSRKIKPASKQVGDHSKESSSANTLNNTSLVYVFDKNGFNKVIAYTKANIDGSHSADLKLNKRSSQHKKIGKKPASNKKARIFNTIPTMGRHVHACRSRELRGGILSTDCFCLRRNGLQYDCRRTGCQNNPECSTLPAPICEPSRVACNTHRTNPHAQALTDICNMRPRY